MKGICPSCGKKTTFVYIGEQEGALEYLGKRVFWYNCCSCGTTVSKESIKHAEG